MNASVEDIFDNDEAVIKVEATEEVETQVEETEAAAEEVTGEKQVEESTPDESPSSETSVPITALHGERDRRQEAERKLAELEAQLQPSEEEPITSVFEDEGSFVNDLEGKFNQALVNRTLNESQFHAEQKYGAEALAEKVETFKQLVQENPRYAEQFSQSVSPYFTLVDLVDKHQELEEIKDVDSYRAKIEAELRQKITAEMAAEQEEKANLKSSVPESLAGDESKGGLTGSTWTGPPSAESLFDD